MVIMIFPPLFAPNLLLIQNVFLHIGEDVNSISPTLGFNIKTLEHNGYEERHKMLAIKLLKIKLIF